MPDPAAAPRPVQPWPVAPPPEGPLSRRGKDLLDDDRPAEAVDVLRRAVAAGEPGSADLLARAYLDSGSWQACIEWLAPHVARGHAEFAGRLGVAYAALGDVDNAEDALRLAVESGETVAANDLAILLRDTDRLAEALHVLRQAAEAGDEQAPANLVALYLEAGELIEAAAAADRYADESRPDTIVALGDVRAAESKPAAAEQAYLRAIQLGGVRAHTAYGQLLLAAYDDAAGAERQFRLAWRHNEPGWPYTLGRFLIDDGRPEEAREFLEEAASWGDRDASDLLNEIDGVDPADDGT
jgi:tetratricopeptide (TPR) repeat protein